MPWSTVIVFELPHDIYNTTGIPMQAGGEERAAPRLTEPAWCSWPLSS